jgi:proline dehydrogenase
MLHKALLSTLPYVPRSVMRRLADRYIAGETLEEALARLRALRERGYPGILDVLGEYARDEAEARAACDAYRAAAEALRREDLDAYISIKPTHFGLKLSEDLCYELYASAAQRCSELGLAVRVEMEDHPTTDGTLRVFERLRRRFENVGIVLQSRLRRTPQDIEALAEGPLDVRMVKGVYLEPASLAHTEPEAIRQAFVECTEQLFRRGARVALATHDEALSARLIALARARGIGAERYEFQVLMGVAEPLWERLRTAGHPVRVYVPFGPEWRAYSLRRMQKNPELFKAVVRNVLRRR